MGGEAEIGRRNSDLKEKEIKQKALGVACHVRKKKNLEIGKLQLSIRRRQGAICQMWEKRRGRQDTGERSDISLKRIKARQKEKDAFCPNQTRCRRGNIEKPRPLIKERASTFADERLWRPRKAYLGVERGSKGPGKNINILRKQIKKKKIFACPEKTSQPARKERAETTPFHSKAGKRKSGGGTVKKGKKNTKWLKKDVWPVQGV